MRSSDLLIDGFERIRGVVERTLDGLTVDQLTARLDSEANSIAWLVWHLLRIQDDHIADAAGTEQAWTADGWAERFDLPFDVSATGYGQRSEEVAAVAVNAADLAGYGAAVHERTIRYVSGLHDEDLDRVVDEAWDPPVTLAVRLVSVLADGLQHAGQAAYVRGIVERGAR